MGDLVVTFAETDNAANPHETVNAVEFQVLASNFVGVRVPSWAPLIIQWVF